MYVAFVRAVFTVVVVCSATTVYIVSFIVADAILLRTIKAEISDLRFEIGRIAVVLFSTTSKRNKQINVQLIDGE